MIKLNMIDAVEYRMPLKRPYGTARGVTRASSNFLVFISTSLDGKALVGVGECQPRHNLTGDGDKRRTAAWRFLSVACATLQGREIPISSPDEAIGVVRALMGELSDIAESLAMPAHKSKPFRGTMLGIEVAMLDLVSRAIGIEVCELLGKQRDRVSISISTISSANSFESIPKKVAIQSRYPMTRVKGTGEIDYDLSIMKEVFRVNQGLGRVKPVWIDINEAHNMPTAEEFVDSVAELMCEGSLPSEVCIEGMLPKKDGRNLALLQIRADEKLKSFGKDELDLRIMPDEGLWDTADLEELNSLGGCRAINIKAPKAGGLLPSLDLARAAVKHNPDVHICIGGMVGTSDITTWALYNLAKALPRIDYITATPPGNVEERISFPLAAFESRESSALILQNDRGIGAKVNRKKLTPYVVRKMRFGGEVGLF